MADRYAKADELLRTLKRFNPELAMHANSGSYFAGCFRSTTGDYVRFEDVRSMLEALMLREP